MFTGAPEVGFVLYYKNFKRIKMKTRISLIAIILVTATIGAFAYWTFSAPSNVSPGTVAPATIPVINTATPLLNCDDVSGADTYVFQLSTASDFSSLIINQSVSSSQFQVPSSTLSDLSIYYMRVKAQDYNNNEPPGLVQDGDWSQTHRFQVDF